MPQRRLRAAPAAEPRKAKAEEPAVEPSTFIVVFGDGLADLVSQGLDDAYDEAAEIEVVDKARSDSGLVRADVYDWPKVIQEYLAGNPKITFAVMMVGSSDRQPIREGEVTHDFLSERWRQLYGERVDAVARLFAERKIPLVWVGAPPMKNEKASADMIVLNGIYRDHVQKGGGVYVDIWPGFVNDQDRYTPVGPDVDGQSARLRTGDGVMFTPAGGRKAAHFATVEIKRLREAHAGASAAAPAGLPEAAPSTPVEPAGAPNPAPQAAVRPVAPPKAEIGPSCR